MRYFEKRTFCEISKEQGLRILELQKFIKIINKYDWTKKKPVSSLFLSLMKMVSFLMFIEGSESSSKDKKLNDCLNTENNLN